MGYALDRISLRYPGRRAVLALEEISLTIDRGERIALMGASASGKSSLLRLLAGLECPSTGRVLRDGAEITALAPPERGVGMVLQDAPLYDHLSLVDNVAQPLRTRGTRRDTAHAAALAMLERLQLAAPLTARPSEISGGERRRVALARALVTRPALLLLDEPFASLDPALRMELRDEVRRLTTEFDCACVHATHDGLEALALGTRLVVLDAGRVVDDGTPQNLWSHPRSARSAVLLGAVPMNLIADSAIGIRPEHVTLTTAAASKGAWSAEGVVESIDPLGDSSLVTLRLDSSERIRAVRPESAPAIAPHDRVRVSAQESHLHRFTSSKE